MSYKTKKILSFFISGIMIMFAVVPFFVSAQCADGTTSCIDGGAQDPGTGRPVDPGTGRSSAQDISMNIKISNPFKQDTIQGLIETIVNDILMPIGGVVAVVMIMHAGFLFVTARGEPGQITKAKDALLYAVIGAAILLGAWIISEVISKTITELKT